VDVCVWRGLESCVLDAVFTSEVCLGSGGQG
jgi:hypothetical protein